MTANLERLDAGRGGPFWYRHGGVVRLGPDPVDLDFQAVLLALLQQKMPGTPNMPLYKREALFRRWAAHYDLPPFAHAQRLTFLMDRYSDDLAYDLQVWTRTDAGDLWRRRRWHTLLTMIDRLPPHCYYAEAVSKDPEHAKALAEAMAAAPGGQDASPKAPPMRIWTPEVQVLTNIYDAIRHVDWTILATNVGKKAPKPPDPSPTPTNLLSVETKRAEFKRRQAKHQALTKRLLPHKRD